MSFSPGQVITDAALNAHGKQGAQVFKVVQTVAQSLPNATFTALTWPSPKVDEFSAYSGANPSRFTPNVAGIYLFSGHVQYAINTSGTRQVAWGLNGSNDSGEVQLTASAFASGFGNLLAPFWSIELNGSTDYVELLARQSSGSTVDTRTGINSSHMTVIYAGPA